MPRYRVVENRMYESRMLIDAENEQAAKSGQGEIVDEAETDSYGYEIVSIEEVDPEEDEA